MKANGDNARKHGFFSREIAIPESEQAEYGELKTQLLEQLRPQNPLQRIAADQVVYCAWQCRRAARAESTFWARAVQPAIAPETESPTSAPQVMDGWYGASKQALRQAIRFLDHVMAEYGANHHLRDETKEALKNAFGLEFVEIVNEWAPSDYDAVLMAHALIAKAKTFHMNLPRGLEEDLAPGKLVIDLEKSDQMVLKLLDQHRLFLEDLRRFGEEKWTAASAQEAAGAVEAPRYFANAMKDLQRAVAWFFEVRAKRW
jgi:hypothetical protein